MGEIRQRAERRIGEMMGEQPKATGGQPYQNPTGFSGIPVERRQIDGFRENPSNPTPSYAQAGIDKNLAKRARKAASVPLTFAIGPMR